jgi:hypothetical protein
MISGRLINMKLIFPIIVISILVLSNFIFSQSLVINEFMASNLNLIDDNNGDYEDWIEIYNTTDSLLDLAGCYITDDSMELTKWQIPKGYPDSTIIDSSGYRLLWADDQPWEGPLHLGFKLSKEGEQIFLVDSDGLTILDSITYHTQTTNVSMGCYPDGTDFWFYYDQPTPGFANIPGFMGVADSIKFSNPAGLYNPSLSISISDDDPLSEIVYTLDGSNPDSLSTKFTSPMVLNSSTVIRSRAIKDNYIDGPIVSNAYYINENFNLPVLTLITDPKNMFDAEIGIYANYNKYGFDWERDIHVQYFKDQLEFSIPSGIRIQGSTSRSRLKKSFRLFFRDSYGADRLEYELFENSPVQSFKNVVLRSGYDDDVQMSNGTLLRDPLVSETWNDLDQLTSLSNFAVLYINNDYWGIYNIRESINEFFLQDHLGFQSFDLMRFEKWGAVLKYGSRASWDDFWDFVETGDFTNEIDYEDMQSQLDMDNFLALQAIIQCTQYRSWTWGCFAFKESVPAAKWQFTIWDMDRAYTDLNWNGFNNYNDISNEKWTNLLVQKLLLNTDFKYAFINRVADYLNSYCSTEAMINRLDSLVAIIEPEMPNEVGRWGVTLSKWQANIEFLRNYARQRPDVVRNQILAQYSISDTINITLMTDADRGILKLNSLSIKKFPWSGIYFTNIPVTVSATPKPGYKFTGWIPDSYPPDQKTISVNSSESISIQAVFETDPNTNIVINEINYNAHPDFDPGDWIELYNPNDFEVDLSNCQLKDENTSGNVFKFPDSQTISAHEFLVLCESLNNFNKIFPDVNNCIGNFGGATGFGFSGSGEKIQLLNSLNQVIDEVNYDDSLPWPIEADGQGYTLELIESNMDNSLAENWRASKIVGGSPGQMNSVTSIGYKEIDDKPLTFKLYQNYPNPFNPKTIIRYLLPITCNIDLSIYNILGQKVVSLVSEKQNAGNYTVEWDATGFPTGIYFYSIKTDKFKSVGKMILMQ